MPGRIRRSGPSGSTAPCARRHTKCHRVRRPGKQTGTGEHDICLTSQHLAFCKSNRYLIKARGNWLRRGGCLTVCSFIWEYLFHFHGAEGKSFCSLRMSSEMIYVLVWGRAACPDLLLLPPHCLFSSRHMCNVPRFPVISHRRRPARGLTRTRLVKY